MHEPKQAANRNQSSLESTCSKCR